MKPPSRVALGLLFAAGAVVASGNTASAETPPPCHGWQTAASHSEAGPVGSFESLCYGAPDGSLKQGFPVKWTGGG